MIFAIVDSGERQIYDIVSALTANFIYFLYLVSHNNMTDVDEDISSKNYFKKYSYSKKRMVTITTLLGLSTLFTAYLGNMLIYGLLAIILNYLYSNKPFRFKDYLIPSLLINIYLFSYVYLFTFRICNNGIESIYELKMLPFICLIYFSLQYIHFLEHLEEDGRSIKKIHFYNINLFFVPFYYYILVSDKYDVSNFVIIILFQCGIAVSLYKVKNYKVARLRARRVAAIVGGMLAVQSII